MPRESANPTWSDKRERQYEHIKEGVARGKGEGEDKAEEIAARTVNKERARAGETEAVESASTETSHRVGAAGYADLGLGDGPTTSFYNEAHPPRTSRAVRR